ncbi:MAG TPA: dNTP triphosphohydrolase, partial [Bacteroidales bacterium]|nr:dNTP triphosphohydrolase [Bacteroidales bacterium]
MNWDQLLSAKRLGAEKRQFKNNEEIRSQFQRDYDRLIFSSPFRRLQNKTQVFPLPGSVFVHNRLTHSLEVASVGRSLANLVARDLINNAHIKNKDILNELGSIVSAACLAHDMGNPPFGHAGEEAISKYFSEGEGKKFQKAVSEEEWNDLTHFEGNANAFRLLTHQFKGRRKGGFALTYSTLASLIKYPY